MAKEGSNWEGLLKWSLAHSDGTRPPRNLSEEERKWFMEAMQSQTVDVVKRMKEITLVMKTPEDVLGAQGVTSADIEDMLDELQEHVESIDMANVFRNNDLPSQKYPWCRYLRRFESAELLVHMIQGRDQDYVKHVSSYWLEKMERGTNRSEPPPNLSFDLVVVGPPAPRIRPRAPRAPIRLGGVNKI